MVEDAYYVNYPSWPQKHRTDHREFICDAETLPIPQPFVRCSIRRWNASELHVRFTMVRRGWPLSILFSTVFSILCICKIRKWSSLSDKQQH